MKVVIADDSKLLRDRVSKILYDLDEIEFIGKADNTFVGYDLIKKLNPELAIIDIRMPGSGIELLKKIKQNYSQTKVIVYTNYPHVQYKNKCMEEGADYFFSKGDDVVSILDAVKEVAETT